MSCAALSGGKSGDMETTRSSYPLSRNVNLPHTPIVQIILGRNLLILGGPEVTENIFCKFTKPSQYRYAKLQYRFAVTSGSPSIVVTENVIIIDYVSAAQ